jgi:hypothetical protein
VGNTLAWRSLSIDPCGIRGCHKHFYLRKFLKPQVAVSVAAVAAVAVATVVAVVVAEVVAVAVAVE